VGRLGDDSLERAPNGARETRGKLAALPAALPAAFAPFRKVPHHLILIVIFFLQENMHLNNLVFLFFSFFGSGCIAIASALLTGSFRCIRFCLFCGTPSEALSRLYQPRILRPRRIFQRSSSSFFFLGTIPDFSDISRFCTHPLQNSHPCKVPPQPFRFISLVRSLQTSDPNSDFHFSYLPSHGPKDKKKRLKRESPFKIHG